MNVHLTPELEQLVHAKVKTGRYNSASEVVREALRLLEEHDQVRQLRFEEIRRKIQEGWDSLRRGEGVDGDEFMTRLEAEIPARRVPAPTTPLSSKRSPRSRLSPTFGSEAHR